MNRKHLQLIILFTLSYLALLLYPAAYFISPVIATATHKLFIGTIFLLTLPAYIFAFKTFGRSFPIKLFTYTFKHGRIIQRAFVIVITFFILGIINGLLFSAVTNTNMIPFSFWNPYIEGGVLVTTLGALLIQLSVFHHLKEQLSIEEDSQDTLEDQDLNLQNF